VPTDAKIAKLLAGIPNPFLQDRVDSPWQETFLDVPEINRTAFQDCQNSINDVYLGNQSRGLILHGEPGSGKTHLLQRVRFYTQTEPRTWFISVPPFPGPSRFWRHLLERFFYDICQRSKLPEPTVSAVSGIKVGEEGPGQGPLTQIEEALTRHLLGRPLGSSDELARLWADICRQAPPGESLSRRLKPTFDLLTEKLRLDPDVMKVIRNYLSWNHRSIAYAYLIGRDLPEDELKLLGITQSLDDEERAKQAVLTFCHLAGPNFTIILAFDQMEGLQHTVGDLDALRAFARNAVYLMTECSNLLILSTVQTFFLDTLKKATMHTADYDRIAQDKSALTLLSAESAKRLIKFRLSIREELFGRQQENLQREPLWPFKAEEIENLVAHEGVSPRKLIRDARHLFDQKKYLQPFIGRKGEEIKPPAVDETISFYWKEQFEKEMEKPTTRLDEGVYEDGLLRLLQVKPAKGWRAHRGTERDLHAILEGKDQKLGVSISNSENMTSLARQLGRLQEILSKGTVNRLIFIRDARLPISETAKVTQKRLKEFTQRGSRVVRPPAEAYAALNVLRQLWAKTAENDLTIGDTSVSMGQLQRWLAENTPRPLQELLDAVQEIPLATPETLADRLLEFLTGRWIMPLRDAAQELGITEVELSRFVIEKPDLTGLLAGPPGVLFLNPEATSRYG
jgi:hypothetical protein